MKSQAEIEAAKWAEVRYALTLLGDRLSELLEFQLPRDVWQVVKAQKLEDGTTPRQQIDLSENELRMLRFSINRAIDSI